MFCHTFCRGIYLTRLTHHNICFVVFFRFIWLNIVKLFCMTQDKIYAQMTKNLNAKKAMTNISTKQKTRVAVNISVLVMIFGAVVLAVGIFMLFSQLTSSRISTKPVSICPTITTQQLAEADNIDSYLQTMITSNCASSLVAREGTLYIVIAENFETEQSKTSYSLYSNGQTTPLYFSGTPDASLRHGDTVSITGYTIDNNGALLLDANNISVSADKAENPYAPIEGPQETIIVRIQFSDHSGANPIASVVRGAMDDVDSFYLENSYNQVDFKGAVHQDKSADIYGEYTLSVPRPDCNFGELIDGVTQDVVDYLYDNSIVDLAQYNEHGKLIIIAPLNCWWGGLAHLGPRTISLPGGSTVDMGLSLINTLINNNVYNYSQKILHVTMSHELGHNFGHNHAGYFGCNIFNTLTDPSQCTNFNEYGDEFEDMGKYAMHHYNAKHKNESGWFTDWNPQIGIGRRAIVSEETVTNNGIYTLEPIETNSNGLKTLMIPRVNPDEYIYVEFRQPIGKDVAMSEFGGKTHNIYNGAFLHADPVAGTTNYSYAFLPDGSVLPRITYAGYPALEVGKSFNDPQTHTTISVESIAIDEDNPENSRLTVKVIFNDIPTDVGDACIDGTPSGQCDTAGNDGRLCIDGAFVESNCLTCGCQTDYVCDPTATGGPICTQSICTDSYQSTPNTHPGTCTDASGTYGGSCNGTVASEYYCSNGTGIVGTCILRQLQTCSDVCLNGLCVACADNADCRDSDSCTIDTCLNPGQSNASCSNEPAPNTCGDRECGVYGCSNCGSCSAGESCNDGYCELPCSDGTVSGSCNGVGSAQYCNDGTLEDSDCRTCGCQSLYSCLSTDGETYFCKFDESICVKYPDHPLCPDDVVR